MTKSIHFEGTNSEGNPVRIALTSEKDFEPEKNIGIALEQIAFEAAQAAKGSTASVAVRQSEDSLSFEVAGEKRQIALSAIDEKVAVAKFKEKSPIALVAKPQELSSLLDRFSTQPVRSRSTCDKIGQILASFFAAIRAAFQYLSQIWGGVGPAERKLQWDINLLAEICETPAPKQLTQLQALQYMDKMLETEQDALSDPSLHKRIRGAIALSEKIHALRGSFNASKFQSLVKEIQGAVENQGSEKILLPIELFQGNQRRELFLEIGAEQNGRRTVALISASEEMRDHFDRVMGAETTSQSIRREIQDVPTGALFGAIPLLLEIQSAPACVGSNEDLSATLLRALQFDGSKVTATPTTETVAKGVSPSPLNEIISYSAKEKKGDEGKRFELALRLRAFLDLCKDNPSLKNKEFWTLARTTAIQLAHLIEKDKEILGSKDEQGLELTRIYGELRGLLDSLESHLPELKRLRSASHFRGLIETQTDASTPHLVPLSREPTTSLEVEPPLAPVAGEPPLAVLKQWAQRLKNLTEIKDTTRAGHEAKLIVRMVPKPSDPFWKNLNAAEATEALSALTTISQAIVRGTERKSQPSLQDIASLAALNYYSLPLLQQIKANTDPYYPPLAHKVMKDLFNTHLPLSERNWLKEIYASFSLEQKYGTCKEAAELVDGLAFVVTGIRDWYDYRTPLALRSPEFAAALLRETNNSALIEYCPFGCGRDDHYELALGYAKHSYPTVYLLNQHNTFDPRALMKEGTLFRDEATDLLYVQQTNQDPPHFHTLTEHSHLPLSGHFDENDRRIQLMNSFALYFDHPHFFKHPALRWQFEAKVFTYESFKAFLDAKDFSLNQPFLTGIFHRLKREIQLAKAASDLGTASYLLYIAAEMNEMIQESSLLPEQKAALKLSFDSEQLFSSWASELVGNSDEGSREHQKILFPRLLSRYFKRFCNNPNDACFEKSETLELILSMVGRLESISKGKERLDQECRDQYLSLLQWLAPKIRAKMARDKSFINKVLLCLNPVVAGLQLEWDAPDFPTLLALDKNNKMYQFDLFSGTMSFGQNRIDPLPDNVKWDEGVQRIFGSAADNNWRVFGSSSHQGTFGYTSDAFPDYRIVVNKPADIPGAFDRKSNIVIERYVNGQWLRYVRFTAQNLLQQQLSPSKEPDLPLQAAIAIGDRDCWLHPGGKRISVLASEQIKPYAILHLSKNLLVSYISKIEFPGEGSCLLVADDKSLSRFTTLEDPAYLQIKGSPSHPSTVEYVRYKIADNGSPLLYAIEKDKIASKTYPGYTLQPFGERPGKRDPALGVDPLPRSFDGFHLLKKDGAEKILMPLRQYEPVKTTAAEQLPHSKPLFPDTLEEVPVFEYTVDPETNRLLAKSGEAYAYLSYICFLHRDYDSASFYLGKARTATGYGDSYQKISAWTSSLKDNSPSGVALQLRFALFDEAQQRVDASSRKGTLTKIGELYKQYKSHERSAGTSGRDVCLDLTPSEEETLALCMKELTETWGDDEIARPSSVQRPSEVAPLPLVAEDPVDLLSLRRSAKMVWAELGNSEQQTPLSFQDPDWPLLHFRATFNQILALHPSSAAFHTLERQLRATSRHPALQATLLKLISAKKSNNPLALKPLPRLEGFWLQRSRENTLELARIALSPPYLDRFALASPSRAQEKARVMQQSKNRSLRSLGRKISAFAASAAPADFLLAMKAFLLKEFYGSHGAPCLLELNQAIEHLDPIELEAPTQVIEKIPEPPAQPPETVASRYRPLVPEEPVEGAPAPEPAPRQEIPQKAVRPSTWSEWISSLFFSPSPEPVEEPEPIVEAAPPQPVTTDPQKIHTVLKESYLSYFVESAEPRAPIDESFFARIKDPALLRLAQEHLEDLRAHVQDQKSVSIPKEKAEELQAELQIEREELGIEREKLKLDLLQEVERFNTPAGILAIRRLAGKGVKPSLELLISLWRRGEIANIARLGLQQMPAAVLKALDQKIGTYLEAATRERHLDRALDLLGGYLTSESDPLLLEGVYDALATKRHFALEDVDARDLLFLEYMQGIILRKQQIAILREMLTDPNAVRQLRMGDGKSKVLLPMLAKRKANGTNLIMLMLPEELYETNCRDLDRTNRHLFGQSMHRFDFSRSSDRSEKQLRTTLSMLRKTIKDQGFVMTTKTSILSCRNAYLELLSLLPSTDDPTQKERLLGQIRAMSEILTLFAEKTDVIADEIDACLDVRKEVNYSLHQGEPLSEVKANVGVRLIELLLQAAPGEPLFELARALENNTQAALSPAKREELLHALAAAYATAHLPGFDPQEFADYTMNKPSAKKVEESVFAEKTNNPDFFRAVTSVKAFIDRGFHTTFGRVGNVNYGRDPVSGMWTIPYKASNTPHVGSEFDDDIEKIAFTVQDYLQNGVTEEQVHRIISRLRSAALQEVRLSDPDRFLSIADTEAGKEFKQFLDAIDPEKKLGAHMNLAGMDGRQNIEALVAIINSSAKGKLAFCHSQVIKKMRQFNAQIHSVATDVADIVHNFSGFTGTPWNLHTYHDKIHAQKNLGVDGSTWALMLGRDVEVRTFGFDAAKPFDSLLDNLNILGNVQAVVDTGAYLRGTDNDAFIDRAKEKAGEKMAGGIYFDASGRIVKKVDGKALPLELAPPTELMENLTLYDQAHTVGADIQQGKSAVAIVTIGENTFIRDLFQAVWRMRQLHKGQRVILAVSDKIKERILAGVNRPLTKEDIYQFCLMNQAMRESDDNYRAEKEKIQGSAKRLAVRQIAAHIARGADTETIEKIAATAQEQDLFIKRRPQDEAYAHYGAINTLEAPHLSLERGIEAELKRCEELSEAFGQIAPALAEPFDALGGEIAEREPVPAAWCPPLINSSNQEGGVVEVEAQAETEQETQTEIATETETEQELELIAETLVPQVGNGEGDHGRVTPMDPLELAAQISRKELLPFKFRQISDTLPFFDEGIFVSAMLERNLRQSKGAASPQSVFYSNRKPVKHVLVAKQNNRWTAILPSTHEGHGPCREYFKTAPADVAAIQVALSPNLPLVIHKSGEERTDALPFTTPEDRAQYYRLYVQAKLFNGEIEYLAEEKEALKKWLTEKGVQNFKNYFELNILAAKPKRFRDAYPKSSLARLFKELTP